MAGVMRIHGSVLVDVSSIILRRGAATFLVIRLAEAPHSRIATAVLELQIDPPSWCRLAVWADMQRRPEHHPRLRHQAVAQSAVCRPHAAGWKALMERVPRLRPLMAW